MYPHFNSSARKPGTGVNIGLDAQGRTALHFATESENTSEMDRLLRVGADPEQKDNAGETPLFIAVRKKNLEVISRLLDKGASFRTTDDKGRTAIDAAIEAGCAVDFIERLKALGGRVEPPAENVRSVLHNAVEKQASAETIGWLVAQGIPVDQQDDRGRTALHVAIESGNYAALEKLLALGADPVIRDNQIATPLHYAASAGDEKAADILLSLPAVRENINSYKTYNEGFTPLMTAVAGNHAALVEKIARLGGDVNQFDNQKRHSLFIAVEMGNLSAAKSLVGLGADIEKSRKCTSNDSYITHWVNQKNYAELMLLLHQAGIDLNLQDGSGQTALHKACDQMDREKIHTLLGLGADPNIPNEFGLRPLDLVLDHYNYDNLDGAEIVSMLLARRASADISPAPDAKAAPLHVAARTGRTETVKLLLQNNPTVDVPDRTSSGMTPLLIALEHGQEEAAEALRAAGADMLRKDAADKTALHFAATSGKASLVAFVLAQQGIDIDARDRDGKTALHYACSLGRTEAAKTLAGKGAHAALYDAEGLTPLHAAATAGNVSLLDLLAGEASLRTDLNVPTRDEGFTPLHLAVRDNSPQFAARLLELGADVAKPAKSGLLPLHYAILMDREPIAEKLLAAMKHRQANLDRFRDSNGWTLLHYAATRETPQMASLLIAAGAATEAVAESGDTALHIAVRAGRAAIVEYLVDSKQMDITRANKEGETPLSLAIKHGREDVAAFLRTRAPAETPEAAIPKTPLPRPKGP